MRSKLALSFAIATLTITAAPRLAEARLSLGAEVAPLFAFGEAAEGRVGFGVAGRRGDTLPLPPLDITPEVKVAWDRLPYAIDVGLVRVMAGGRVAAGAGIKLVLFGHIGYGWGSSEEGGIDLSPDGLALDLGVGLDFTLLPLLDVGVFASYNTLATSGADTHWISVGGQATLRF